MEGIALIVIIIVALVLLLAVVVTARRRITTILRTETQAKAKEPLAQSLLWVYSPLMLLSLILGGAILGGVIGSLLVCWTYDSAFLCSVTGIIYGVPIGIGVGLVGGILLVVRSHKEKKRREPEYKPKAE